MNVRNFRDNSREIVSVSKIFDEYCSSAPDKILKFFVTQSNLPASTRNSREVLC